MTLTELQARRDQILSGVASPEEIRSADGDAIRNRLAPDAERALAMIDREIARLSSATGSRVTLVQHSRG